MTWCTGFGWSWVNFLHSSFFGVLLLCWTQCWYYRGVSDFFLRRAFTKPRSFLPLTPSQPQQDWGSTDAWGRDNLVCWSQMKQGIFQTTLLSRWVCKAGEKMEEGMTFGVMLSVLESACYMWWGPDPLEMTACPQEMVVHGFSFTYWIGFRNWKTCRLSYSSDSLPHPALVGVSKQLHGAWLLSGVKPWYLINCLIIY